MPTGEQPPRTYPVSPRRSLTCTISSFLLPLAAAHFYQRRPVLVKRLCIGLAVAAGLFFVCYYPVISGLPVAESYVNALRILPSWMF